MNLHQELTRTQKDAGIGGADFWGAIANQFNDFSLSPHFPFDGTLGQDTDPPLPPLSERSRGVLKSQLSNARSNFTTYISRWNSSGNNDPNTFVNFLPSVNGRLHMFAKRLWIIFTVAHVGRPDEDTSFLECTTKLVKGIIGYDEGISGEATEHLRAKIRSSRSSRPYATENNSIQGHLSSLVDVVQQW